MAKIQFTLKEISILVKSYIKSKVAIGERTREIEMTVW